MSIIASSHSCTLEKVIFECPELTWDQVFIEVNRLRREGLVLLTLKQPGYYVATRIAKPETTQLAIERKVA